MNQNARKPAKVRGKRVLRKPIKLSAQPWYARAAKSIGITARDQTRRVAAGPNALSASGVRS